ncbi:MULTISPECIES: HAD family hydrolase [Pectobacterium]|uniref:HAD family hydrolase n=1 Tax=Pectobacterium TaxID=122277 RepID=UPI001961E098|nr:HAD family hydrolase [Pectobacterium versatile]
MLFMHNFQTFIFDCDGVILDSNSLKIEAMRYALVDAVGNTDIVDVCVDYFKRNFGKSRFHHVDFFAEKILDISIKDRDVFKARILEHYSTSCKELYLTANITPGFLEMLKKIKGVKYVASGSEQEELRWVFTQRKLDCHFSAIYGSPTAKVDIVKKIVALSAMPTTCLMFGDAISDVNAAITSGIHFVGYLPYSNVKQEMVTMCNERKFPVLDNWELLN